MLIEMRTYTFLPGRLPAFLALVEREGLPLQKKHLGQCLGFFTTEVGTMNQVIQLWAYENAGDREVRRTGLTADVAWPGYLAKALPMILSQENVLLKPAPFSPTHIAAQAIE